MLLSRLTCNRYLTKCYIHKSEQIQSVMPLVNHMMGLPKDEELIAWEEISLQRVDYLDPYFTLDDAELGTGDVIVFQTKNSAERTDFKYPSLKNYFAYLENRLYVKFKTLRGHKQDTVCSACFFLTHLFRVSH